MTTRTRTPYSTRLNTPIAQVYRREQVIEIYGLSENLIRIAAADGSIPASFDLRLGVMVREDPDDPESPYVLRPVEFPVWRKVDVWEHLGLPLEFIEPVVKRLYSANQFADMIGFGRNLIGEAIRAGTLTFTDRGPNDGYLFSRQLIADRLGTMPRIWPLIPDDPAYDRQKHQNPFTYSKGSKPTIDTESTLRAVLDDYSARQAEQTRAIVREEIARFAAESQAAATA